jgi:hypothetical protein
MIVQQQVLPYGLNGCCAAMWGEKKWKPTRLLLFLDSFLKKQVRMLDASDRDKATVCINLICKYIYQIPITGNFPFI